MQDSRVRFFMEELGVLLGHRRIILAAIGELANVASVTAEPGAKATASTPTSTAPSIALASAASVTEAVATSR